MLTTLKEQCYDNLRISRNAWDTNLVKVQEMTPAKRGIATEHRTGESAIYLCQLGGQWRWSFCCHTDQCEGAITRAIASLQGAYLCGIGHRLVGSPTIRSKNGAYRLYRSPFNDSLIASGSDDGKVG